MINAKRGEVWLVDLNPTRGQEIQKTRPVIIISSDLFDRIALKIAIPITSWQSKFVDRPFMVRIDANEDNGLEFDSAGNILQIRSLSTDRFVKRLGQISPEILEELLSGLIVCTDYELKS
ncbi:type II toxin-antitoxin system PemK/MazF family toxin [Chamaesiphon sp. OTE_75_metabat_556]|uniref:type II toxin-antitoxin system PemK/MazF family toxin n=1 Tax=Chamaesiphon sp. OTE_75_metabat_556 TaxID=2964692 RepID=UPI00286CB762|nr:type II toxin-antitoxin system PemK/MazF family toxin [Chamaesiphon sp. OTE_75_metabat_556]